jgi:hypothetical protein
MGRRRHVPEARSDIVHDLAHPQSRVACVGGGSSGVGATPREERCSVSARPPRASDNRVDLASGFAIVSQRSSDAVFVELSIGKSEGPSVPAFFGRVQMLEAEARELASIIMRTCDRKPPQKNAKRAARGQE